jgi:hypothetical protein
MWPEEHFIYIFFFCIFYKNNQRMTDTLADKRPDIKYKLNWVDIMKLFLP